MEGPIKTALAANGIDFQGQGAGSKMLANLISAGTKTPDIFISVDPKLVLGLGAKVASATTFAGTSLGIGWSNNSKTRRCSRASPPEKRRCCKHCKHPASSSAAPIRNSIRRASYTIQAMTMLAGAAGEKAILGEDQNTAQIFPEEDLLARIDTGQADVGFFYKTEAVARDLHFVPLPGAASLSDKITYTLAVMNNAPHPDQAKAFAAFILTGDGKSILQKAGIEYLAAPKSIVP